MCLCTHACLCMHTYVCMYGVYLCIILHPVITVVQLCTFCCSNLAYALLGRCIVHHYDSLTTFEKYVEDNILKPLNMTSTGFDYTDQ